MKHRASALLLSVGLTTLLLSLSLVVSALVIWDVRTVSVKVSGMKARYAAEALSELGLLDLKQSLPGFEPAYSEVVLSSTAQGSLSTSAKGMVIPCDDSWRKMDLNESVQIPLFTQINEVGDQQKVLKFVVDFYVGDAEGNPVTKPSFLKNDLLRWKIIGFKDQAGDAQITEAISEFISLLDASHASDASPTQFGSDVGQAVPDAYTKAKYYDTIRFDFFPAYSIFDFLNTHRLNHLVLTSFLDQPETFIYFKLHTTDAPAACEFVTLHSEGAVESAQVLQALETRIREGEHLPVFDFVIYNAED